MNGWTNRSNDRVANQSADQLTKRNVSDMYPDHKTELLRLFRNTQVYKRNMIAYQNVQLLFLCFRYGSHAYWFARWLVGWSFGRVTFFKIFNNGLCDCRGIYFCMISYCLPVVLEENLLFPS